MEPEKESNINDDDINDQDYLTEREDAIPSRFPETDVTLIVEDQKFHVSRAVLSQHSPIFNVMFNGHFKESKEKEIVLKDKKAEHFEEFLRSFYPNMKHPLTGKNELIRMNRKVINLEYKHIFLGKCFSDS